MTNKTKKWKKIFILSIIGVIFLIQSIFNIGVLYMFDNEPICHMEKGFNPYVLEGKTDSLLTYTNGYGDTKTIQFVDSKNIDNFDFINNNRIDIKWCYINSIHDYRVKGMITYQEDD